MGKASYIFLSHLLRSGMPAYNGQSGYQASPTQDMEKGDSTNSLRLMLSNHVGTHLDFPRHFLPTGKTLNDFRPEQFIFTRPAVVHIPVDSGRYIEENELNKLNIDPKADLILVRTGYGCLYASDRYWNDNPGISPSAARYLKNTFPHLRCIGMDFISLNAYKNKDPGREAHKVFLAPPEILLIEDMDLSMLTPGSQNLHTVFCVPLRISAGDGAPCTVIGVVYNQ